MINNINLILPHFYFNEGNEMFMHCQIVQRTKDHKDEEVKGGVLKTYFIRSREHLERLMPEIILLCEHYGARAYINLAGKDFDQLQKLMLQKLATDMYQNIIRNPRKVLNSAAGELKSRNHLWVVDIDDMTTKQPVREWLYNWYLEEYRKGPDTKMPKTYFAERSIVSEIPTVHGCHLIVKPFNLQEFSKVFPDIDVHKNSMGTLLYYPDSLGNGSVHNM